MQKMMNKINPKQGEERIIKIKAKIAVKLKAGQQQRKLMQQIIGSLKRSVKWIICSSTAKKKKKDINYQYQDEMRDITIDPVDIGRIIREYYRQLCMHTFYNLHKVDCFLEWQNDHEEPKMKQIV